MQGYQVHEIAELTGRSLRTVERTLQHCRQQLTAYLHDHEQPPPHAARRVPSGLSGRSTSRRSRPPAPPSRPQRILAAFVPSPPPSHPLPCRRPRRTDPHRPGAALAARRTVLARRLPGRFPQLLEASASVRTLAFEEFRLRRRAGQAPSADEYKLRFGIDPTRAIRDDRLDLVPGPRTPPPATDRFAQVMAALPHVGDQFLEYRLLAELGAGAYGRAFLAERAGRRVALKVGPAFGAEPLAPAAAPQYRAGRRSVSRRLGPRRSHAVPRRRHAGPRAQGGRGLGRSRRSAERCCSSQPETGTARRRSSAVRRRACARTGSGLLCRRRFVAGRRDGRRAGPCPRAGCAAPGPEAGERTVHDVRAGRCCSISIRRWLIRSNRPAGRCRTWRRNRSTRSAADRGRSTVGPTCSPSGVILYPVFHRPIAVCDRAGLIRPQRLGRGMLAEREQPPPNPAACQSVGAAGGGGRRATTAGARTRQIGSRRAGIDRGTAADSPRHALPLPPGPAGLASAGKAEQLKRRTRRAGKESFLAGPSGSGRKTGLTSSPPPTDVSDAADAAIASSVTLAGSGVLAVLPASIGEPARRV